MKTFFEKAYQWVMSKIQSLFPQPESPNDDIHLLLSKTTQEIARFFNKSRHATAIGTALYAYAHGIALDHELIAAVHWLHVNPSRKQVYAKMIEFGDVSPTGMFSELNDDDQAKLRTWLNGPFNDPTPIADTVPMVHSELSPSGV